MPYTINTNDLNSDAVLSFSQGDGYIVHKYSDNPKPELYNIRSVITRNDVVVCFSPPKSITPANFLELYSSKDTIVEEYIEGTMVNAFCVNDEWKIASRSKINADCFFFDTNGYFSNMANETFIECGVDLNALNKEHCYSFVMQHPNNRIVTKFENVSLYLIATYKIEQCECGAIVHVVDEDASLWRTTAVKFPAKILNFELSTEHPYTHMGVITEQPYTHMGVVFKDPASGARCKLRNPAYEYVRRLRGNQPKLMYHYLELRKTKKIDEYLRYYPEHADKFSMFNYKINVYTMTLYNLYVSVFILKNPNSQGKTERRFKTSLFKLHGIYISQGVKINLDRVISFVNELPEAVLMTVI